MWRRWRINKHNNWHRKQRHAWHNGRNRGGVAWRSMSYACSKRAGVLKQAIGGVIDISLFAASGGVTSAAPPRLRCAWRRSQKQNVKSPAWRRERRTRRWKDRHSVIRCCGRGWCGWTAGDILDWWSAVSRAAVSCDMSLATGNYIGGAASCAQRGIAKCFREEKRMRFLRQRWIVSGFICASPFARALPPARRRSLSRAAAHAVAHLRCCVFAHLLASPRHLATQASVQHLLHHSSFIARCRAAHNIWLRAAPRALRAARAVTLGNRVAARRGDSCRVASSAAVGGAVA